MVVSTPNKIVLGHFASTAHVHDLLLVLVSVLEVKLKLCIVKERWKQTVFLYIYNLLQLFTTS